MSKPAKAAEKLGPCPDCGKNMDVVGLRHRCAGDLLAKELIDTSDIPEATEEDFKRAKMQRLKPKGYGSMKGKLKLDPKIDLTKPIAAQVADKLNEKASTKPLPPAHPDCERCKEQTRRARARMKARRGGK